MQVLQATVLFSAGKSFASKLSKGRDRQSIKLELPNGEEVSIWFDAGHADYCSLVRGEVVTVIQDKDKYTVVFPDAEEETPKDAVACLSEARIARVQAAQVAQSVSAIANGNGSAPQVTPAIGAASLNPQLKAEIFKELCTRAKILRTCHIQMQQLFTNADDEVIISEETLQQYAITLYLDLKKFWS